MLCARLCERGGGPGARERKRQQHLLQPGASRQTLRARGRPRRDKGKRRRPPTKVKLRRVLRANLCVQVGGHRTARVSGGSPQHRFWRRVLRAMQRAAGAAPALQHDGGGHQRKSGTRIGSTSGSGWRAGRACERGGPLHCQVGRGEKERVQRPSVREGRPPALQGPT